MCRKRKRAMEHLVGGEFKTATAQAQCSSHAEAVRDRGGTLTVGGQQTETTHLRSRYAPKDWNRAINVLSYMTAALRLHVVSKK